MFKNEIEKFFEEGIEKEKQASAFYDKLARMFLKPNIKQMFSDMSEQELSHAKFLEKMKEKPLYEFEIKAPSVNFSVAEEIQKPKIKADITPETVIKIAMKREQEAIVYYQNMKLKSKSPQIQNLCQQMINMEMVHKNNLEQYFAEIIIEMRGLLKDNDDWLTIDDLR